MITPFFHLDCFIYEPIEKMMESFKEKFKIAKENLKAQVSRLKARIAEIENSTSFKIGKAITYLPGLIKKAIKGKK